MDVNYHEYLLRLLPPLKLVAMI